MIREEYVDFETARLLKAAGFPQDDDYKAYDSEGFLYANLWEVESECYAAPHQSQAMRWLREDKKLFVEISFDPGFVRPPYYVEIQTLPEGGFIDYIGYPMAHSTYGAAAEAGIQAACEYLIEEGGEA